MARITSIGLTEEQAERLARVAERLGRQPTDIGDLLLEEALRTAEHDGIEFRDSPIGRLAYVRGSSLAVWEVAMVARDYGGDAAGVAAYLGWPLWRVEAALSYARAYAPEIEALIEANAAHTYDSLRRLLPNLQRLSLRHNPATEEDDVITSS